MHHFFVRANQIKEQQIEIEGGDVTHICQVLRLRKGEKLTVSDGENQTYLCEMGERKGSILQLSILQKEEVNRELSTELYLFQGLPKQDKMEWIIQKSVELGVREVIPVSMKRSVVQFDEKKKKKKQERWQQIAESAAKQSGRGVIPKVKEVMELEEALAFASTLDTVLLPYELAQNMKESQEVIRQLSKRGRVGVFIGPEGGFEKEEVGKIERIGGKTVSLGKRILRTETAAISILSILMFQVEGDDGSIFG